MKGLFLWGITVCLITLALSVVSTSEEAQAVVNLMIDADMHPAPTEDQINTAVGDLINVTNDVSKRNLNATLYLAGDMTASRARVFITQIGTSPRYEIAMAGNTTDEKLSRMPASAQKTILERSKKLAEACHICGGNTITVTGFKPQSFDQNGDTFRLLDGMGIDYSAGFQQGVLYTTGHLKDAWPYQVTPHKFYAVPVSTYNYSGGHLVLYDRKAQEMGLTGDQWYGILVGKFDEASAKGEPVVAVFSTMISGSGAYQAALEKFLDYADSKKAEFVTTQQLVDISKKGVPWAEGVSMIGGSEVEKGYTVCDTLANVTVESGSQD
jgi:hypothetical protein